MASASRTTFVAEAWVEVTSDGKGRGGTHVWLVLVDHDGNETRYEIPGVTQAIWRQRAGEMPVLSLELAHTNTKVRQRVDVKNTSVDDLLAEIAAARLTRSGEGCVCNCKSLPAGPDHEGFCPLFREA